VIEEMDTDAVIERHPAGALVDEHAHSHAPGSRHANRWRDVEDLLAAGITVISTVNIQHVESLADIVANITGVQVLERVPDRVIDDADEVELIDMSPHALHHRTELLAVYVETPGWRRASPEQKRALEENVRFAEDLGADAIRVQAADVARALMQVAHDKNVGSLITGHSRHGLVHELLGRSVLQNLLRLASDVDVHVVAELKRHDH
jgi:K+-sensing histidine kinase KdpD